MINSPMINIVGIRIKYFFLSMFIPPFVIHHIPGKAGDVFEINYNLFVASPTVFFL